MTGRAARSMVVLLAALGAGVACQPAARVSAVPAPSAAQSLLPGPPPIASPAPAYPPSYPLLDDAELERREVDAEAKNPGWEVTLEPEGLLADAFWNPDKSPIPQTSVEERSRPLSDVERIRADEFLKNNIDLLGGDARAMERVENKDARASSYRQMNGTVLVHLVGVRRRIAGLTITGHFWPPVVIQVRPRVPEAMARNMLETADPASVGQPLIQRIVPIVRGAKGTVEAHACILLGRAVPRFCMDSATGEFVTLHLVEKTRTQKRHRSVLSTSVFMDGHD